MNVRRAELLDVLVEGDRCAVMLADSRVVVLSPLATVIVERLERGAASLPEVAAALVDAFGAPPGDEDGIATTGRILSDLMENAVLARAVE